tara:strand:+ start:1672 stop:1869 length:198 start_codon:yes stop_codon:yes gene_type:complete
LASKLSRVLAELKRRKVYGVAALYAAPGDWSADTITGQETRGSIAVLPLVNMSPETRRISAPELV